MSDHSKSAFSSPHNVLQVAHALKTGDVVMEYAIERTLGGGGFGITYLAQDINLNLPVAVKEYLPSDLALRAADNSVHPLGDAFKEQFEWGLERFLAEARVLATFRHPNIVRVLRYFMANGTAYIVMEYESGQSLKHWFPRQGILTQSALLKILFPLLDGLEVIHAADFLHRDIKPDNIYVRDDGTPVLIDFGSARNTNSERELTNIVSPGFAPFEQYHSKGHQGPWTDIYSLAAVMYWMISGTKPQDSLSRFKQDTMVPAAQCEFKELFDEGVLKAVDWALSPEETQRPQSVAELRQRLQESRSGTCIGDVSGQHTVQNAGVMANRTVGGSDISGRNLVCSILFTDIVAYSQASVDEQYEIKSSFNQLIAEKVGHIPENSRITLDTGDGAAICFMGDPEEVLLAAMEIRQTLLAQKRLQVRMGLHIGPVRIISDLNGRDNVIGDGINVAQRVMSFAGSNALLVSRAFYEIVARLTDRSSRSFEYLGERRDKHDRAHEIYSVSAGSAVAEQNDKTVLFSEISSDKTILLKTAQGRAEVDFELAAGTDAPGWKRAVRGGRTYVLKTAGFSQRQARVFWNGAMRGGSTYGLKAADYSQQQTRAFVRWAKIRIPEAIDFAKRNASAFASGVKARVPVVTALAKRTSARILAVTRAGYAWSRENTYWWKLLLATIAAVGIGRYVGGAAWGLSMGLGAAIVGGANFIRLMKRDFAARQAEENAGQPAFAAALGSRQNLQAISVAVAPSLVMTILLWTVLGALAPAKTDKSTLVEKVVDSVTLEFDAESRENLEKARKMLAEKNYKTAISLSQSVLEKHPGNVEAQELHKEGVELHKEALAAQKHHHGWLPF